MKKVLLSITICTFLFGCSSIQVKYDEFKDATIVTLNMNHKAKSESIFKTVRASGCKYVREVKNGVTTVFYYNLKLHGGTNMDDLANKAFVKINNEKYNIVIGERTTGTKITSSSSKDSVTGETKVSTSSSKIFSGKVQLNKQIEKAILNSNSMMYRVYLGSDPIDLIVSEGQLAKMKEFINTNEKK